MVKSPKKKRSIFAEVVAHNTLVNFDSYLELIEEYLKELQDEFKKEVAVEQKKAKEDEEKKAFQVYIENKYYELGTVFPQILRGSFLLSLFAFCEVESEKEIIKLPKTHEITIIKDIRDHIAHKLRINGQDKMRSEKLKKYIDSTPGIDIDRYNDIIIEKKFCKHVIKVFKSYFEEYFKNLKY